MESLGHVKPASCGSNVKKMRKRRELDALVSHAQSGVGIVGASSRRSRDALLSPSSDECTARIHDDAWLKVARRRRRGASAAFVPCGAAARACSVLLVCACLVATAALMWLFVDVRSQIDELRAEMEQVTLSSQGVGDALQRCHSAARDLRNNHTELASRLDWLTARQENITHQLAQMQLGLSAVQQRLSGSSELTTAELGKSVASFGSQLSDLDTRARTLKDQAAATLAQQNTIAQDLENVKLQIGKLSNISTVSDSESARKDMEPLKTKQSELAAILTDLSKNVTSMNETLATKISWATVDISKNQKTINALQESLQNNSASLSSLQAAWRESNDIIFKNMSTLVNDVSTRLADYYKQLLDVKAMQDNLKDVPVSQEVHPVQTLSLIPVNGTKREDTASLPEMQSMHERESDAVPKHWPETWSTTAESVAISKDLPLKAPTGKPNVLSGSGNK